MLIDSDQNPTLFILMHLTNAGMDTDAAFKTMMRFHRLSKPEIARAFRFPDEKPISPTILPAA